ncbi:MAG: right-handed parallel beta-helix repeat-containing protein [Ferruginibacter sp.]
MKKASSLLLVFTASFLFAAANNYYVAPNGNDNNNGSVSAPFATIQKAQTVVQPGDTVFLRGGKYEMSEANISKKERGYACISYLDKSGVAGKYISYINYPGETPVFDYTAVKPEGLRVAAFYVTGSYIHLKGFEVTGVQVTIKGHTQSECFENHGSNNIYEQLVMHDGMAIGFYLLAGSNNLILNCDAYNNWDYFSENGRGGNTDGFGCHPRAGSKNNVFRGCRAWFNSDDGFDLINASEATTFDHCWAFYNGFNKDFVSEGDGNGFKSGGYGLKKLGNEIPNPVPRNTIQFCLAVRNKANGFYSNHHTGGSNWYNNSAYRNGCNFNMLNRLIDTIQDVPGFDHILYNNLGYKGGREIQQTDLDKCTHSNNYFDMNLQAGESDFISLDEKLLTAPRKPDGSLPHTGFMQLQSGSQFIDKGKKIDFPFNGKAPDLGAFETGK